MPATTARYTIISADTHAGGSHAQYREYLDESFREEFDAWRGKYKNPFKDLRDTSDRVRNWDSERRWSDMQRDGVVAEVIFPNTIPPFFPSFVLFAPLACLYSPHSPCEIALFPGKIRATPD